MKPKRRISAPIVIIAFMIIAFAGMVGPAVYTRLLERRRAVQIAQMKPFQFPTAELAALDRDLQARFAVVPTKEFGIERVSGPQHLLYVPENAREQQTIQNLKKKRTEAAFYLMSRQLWIRGWDGAEFKPIQGPVTLTGAKIHPPLPRAINFSAGTDWYLANKRKVNPVMPQPRNLQTNLPGKGDWQGFPVPSPTSPPHAPDPNQLQEIGNQLFAQAEEMPHDKKLGVVETMPKGDWKVAAVPIRASDKACLSCHQVQYPSWPDSPAPQSAIKRKLVVGDALGVAFYLYRQTPKT